MFVFKNIFRNLVCVPETKESRSGFNKKNDKSPISDCAVGVKSALEHELLQTS
jgi:hypothetical protein